MTKREIIELYLADLNNLVPDSDAKRSRIIDLEDELEALRIHDIVGQSEQLPCDECVDGQRWSPYYAKYLKCDCRK